MLLKKYCTLYTDSLGGSTNAVSCHDTHVSFAQVTCYFFVCLPKLTNFGNQKYNYMRISDIAMGGW